MLSVNCGADHTNYVTYWRINEMSKKELTLFLTLVSEENGGFKKKFIGVFVFSQR